VVVLWSLRYTTAKPLDNITELPKHSLPAQFLPNQKTGECKAC
jgi:hypothetical protein